MSETSTAKFVSETSNVRNINSQVCVRNIKCQKHQQPSLCVRNIYCCSQVCVRNIKCQKHQQPSLCQKQQMAKLHTQLWLCELQDNKFSLRHLYSCTMHRDKTRSYEECTRGCFNYNLYNTHKSILHISLGLMKNELVGVV